MSQIYKPGTGGGGVIPPTVPESFVTDVNSPAIPALNVLNVPGGFVTADNANGIRTDGSSGSNTLTVQLTNRITGSATVVGAVTGDVVTFPLSASPSVYRFNFLITGRCTAGTSSGEGLGYTVDGSIRTDGTTATIISTPDIDADEDASLTLALIAASASGNNLVIVVTGVAGQTISYKAVGYYVVVS